ncbi:MAG: SulP family inorganic anion transporter [Gammaproteobacteria bacterium]
MQRIVPNRLSTHRLRGDIYGGLTAAVVALPLAIAFGVASGAGPIAGVYGAVCVGLFASFFGGTPAQISGPTGPMTIISATVFTQFGDRPSVAFTVVMLAGGFQVLFGYLRLGRFVNMMPYPVISGFMTGIGCILIIMQLEPLLGYVGPQNVINALTAFPSIAQHPNWDALVIGLVAFAICTMTPARIGRIVPPPLIALIAGTAMTLILSQAPVLGSIPSGLPQPRMPAIDFTQINTMLLSAAVLAALGSIDSLLTSLVADNVTREFHNSDKELVGQGIGNIVAGLAGGIPGAGATIRTLANVKAGGRTPLSGMIHAVALLAVALGLGPAVAYIPQSALAGVLLKVGVDVIDWRFLRRMHRAPRVDLVLMLVVLVLTIFIDVVTAVGVGVVLASLAFVRDMAEMQVESIRPIADPDHARFLSSEENEVFRQCGGRVLWLHMSGPISFGAANEMTRRISMVGEHDVLVIDLLDVPHLDGSAALAIEEIIQRAASTRQAIIMVGLSFAVARLLVKIGALDEVKETARYGTRRDAVRSAASLVAARRAQGSGSGGA